MAILKLARMGNPILRQKAQVVTQQEIKSPKMTEFISNMLDTLHDAKGLGLAAPQVSCSIQLAVIEIDPNNPRYKDSVHLPKQPLLILFNPEIQILDHEPQGYWEGCLSVPGIRGFVRRPRKIRVNYLNEKAEEKSLIAENFLSTVFQHELDHLDGNLFIDRIHPEDRQKLTFIDEYEQFWKNS